MEWALVLVSLALLGVAAVSRRLVGTPITPAILFVGFGLLVGPSGLGGIDLSSSDSAVRVLAEATLAMVLFCDASRVDLGQLRRAVGVPLPSGNVWRDRLVGAIAHGEAEHDWAVMALDQARASGLP